METSAQAEERGKAAAQLADEHAQIVARQDAMARACGQGPVFSQAAEKVSAWQALETADTDPELARALLDLLHPAGAPPEWWQTPLGCTLAGPVAEVIPADEGVSTSDAARMLGVVHQRVAQLRDEGIVPAVGPVKRGQPVSLAAVLRRVANPPGTGAHGHRPNPRNHLQP